MDGVRIGFAWRLSRLCYMIVKIMATLKKEAFIQENKRLFCSGKNSIAFFPSSK